MWTSDENKEKYQLPDYELIQYQILKTNIVRILWQTVKRITNEISGVKGSTNRYWAAVRQFSDRS